MFTKIQNETKLDRIIRAFLGIAAISAGVFFFQGTTQLILIILGIILLITSFTGFCLFYSVCKRKNNVSKKEVKLWDKSQ
jgi:hypothetical protein